ncbi:MAG: crotonase [Alteromonadaceae bacterium]|nr:crotonase [Alteromonadaceae bacterium]
MSIDEVQREVSGRVLVLTLNRPTKKNALTVPMYRALSDYVMEGDRDPAIGAILLQAKGDSFSAGNDMDDFRKRAEASEPGSSAGLDFIEVLLGCDTPVVASVQGRAIGIGTTMLLHCDFVVADSSARFSTPFVDLGLCPEAASSLLMPLMLGFRRANDLLLAGEMLSAEQALDCQLVSRLCEPEALATAAHELAVKLAAKPAGSMRLSKSLMRRYWRDAIREAIHLEREHFSECLQSPDCRAALDRFFNR